MKRLGSQFIVRKMALLVILCSCTQLRAADVDLRNSSLKFIPADAAMYSASFQLREQVQRFVESNAFNRIRNHPLIQMGMFQAQAMWEGSSAQYAKILEAPENQKLLKVLGDAVSEEIFVYGDENLGNWLGVLVKLGNEINAIQFEIMAEENFVDPEELMTKIVDEILDTIDLTTAPGGVIGFKTSMKGDAQAQVQRLAQFGKSMIENVPDLAILKGRLEMQKIGADEFLTLRLDGAMIPWDELGEEDIPEEIFKKLKKSLNEAQLTISLGVFQDYIVLGIGKDTSVISKMNGSAKLASQDELAPIRKTGKKPFTSVSYTSKEVMELIGGVENVLGQYARMAKAGITMAENEIDDELKEEMQADIDKLMKDIIAFQPKMGATTAYAFMTPAGYEGYSYSWTENNLYDSSKPLSILNHVGGQPLLVIAARGKPDPRGAEFLQKWGNRAFYYADTMIRKQFEEPQDDDNLKKYETAVKEFKPLFHKILDVNKNKLEPAFADGQTAFVLDGKVKRNSWHPEMPPADDPLPMIEFACVSSVSDAKLAREGFSDLFAIAQSAFKKVKELDEDNEIPFDKIPAPEQTQIGSDTMYSYALPPQAQLDEAIRPNAVISDDVMVLSLMPETTKRVLTAKPLEIGGILKNSDRPLAVAVHVNVAGFVDGIEQWVSYAMDLSGQDFSQVEIIFDVLGCFEGVSALTFEEDKATVTHFDIRFQDLE